MDWLKALMEATTPHTQWGGGGSQKREFRVPANLEARLTNGDADPIDVRVQDLSKKGLKILSSAQLMSNAEVDLQVFGRTRQTHIQIKVRVAWSRPEDGAFSSGLEFITFHDTRLKDVVQFFKDELPLDQQRTG